MYPLPLATPTQSRGSGTPDSVSFAPTCFGRRSNGSKGSTTGLRSTASLPICARSVWRRYSSSTTRTRYTRSPFASSDLRRSIPPGLGPSEQGTFVMNYLPAGLTAPPRSIVPGSAWNDDGPALPPDPRASLDLGLRMIWRRKWLFLLVGVPVLLAGF